MLENDAVRQIAGLDAGAALAPDSMQPPTRGRGR
jgi:hypothetical protein